MPIPHTVDDVVKDEVETALKLLTLDQDLHPDVNYVPLEDSWDGVVSPQCTALVPVPLVSKQAKKAVVADPYGLPDLDSLDFSTVDIMPIADVQKPKKQKPLEGIVSSWSSFIDPPSSMETPRREKKGKQDGDKV